MTPTLEPKNADTAEANSKSFGPDVRIDLSDRARCRKSLDCEGKREQEVGEERQEKYLVMMDKKKGPNLRI